MGYVMAHSRKWKRTISVVDGTRTEMKTLYKKSSRKSVNANVDEMAKSAAHRLFVETKKMYVTVLKRWGNIWDFLFQMQ